jgi:hypothetical protein
MSYDPDKLAVCGANERYSPPIVLFEDPASLQIAASATLLFRVDETTSHSQFLAHYAFVPVDHPDTGIVMKGGAKVDDPSSGTNNGIHHHELVFSPNIIQAQNVCSNRGEQPRREKENGAQSCYRSHVLLDRATHFGSRVYIIRGWSTYY